MTEAHSASSDLWALLEQPLELSPQIAIDAPAPSAILGPTNTGKTYFAIERMLSHRSGIIGLPLRLLAREVYDKLVTRCSPRDVALVTGEEKIIPKSPRYFVSTVEAMPLQREVDFLAIDEVQLAADPERGRIFTSRVLHARGRKETLFLGSETMRPILAKLFPGITFSARERFSVLSYVGAKKVTRLPRRTAVVAFSADMVYAIAELIRRQRGGAAVVLGALSPRTRNAQAELYQSGEVDYLVATDAIGMGLNMDIDHVAFAARRKFDGRTMRQLRHDELAQIAGRAGRHLRDGSFGVTADCEPFDDEAIEAIENHRFDPAKGLQWRSEKIDLSSLPALQRSLAARAPREELHRCRPDDDEETLQRLASQSEIRDRAKGGAALALLWQVCALPDFRNVTPDEHARLAGEIFVQLIDDGRINDTWLAPKVAHVDRTDGDIDTLSNRLAHVRTWTYLSNRSGWLENAAHWRDRTRALEDRLSDALHEKLTQRFVDRRTSVLLKKLKDDAPILAGVTDDGDVIVEGQFVGRLIGFEFLIDPRAKGADAKRVRAAADRALAPMIAARAAALATAQPDDLSLTPEATIRWRSSTVATLTKGPTPLSPRLVLKNPDALTPSMRGRVEDRLKDYLAHRIEALLGPLILMGQASESGDDAVLSANARGVAFRVFENFGAMSRVHFGEELKQLGQDERSKLRKLGLRFGEYTLFTPALLKPAPARMLTLLWALWTDRKPSAFEPPKAGLVSVPVIEDLPHAYYYASGYRPSGVRAVRVDMLERLAGQIRSARNDEGSRGAFEASSQMMSLVGCSGDDFEAILKSLGYKKQTIKKRVPKKPSGTTEAQDQTQLGAAATADPEAQKDAAETKQTGATSFAASPEAPKTEDGASTVSAEPTVPAITSGEEPASASETALAESPEPMSAATDVSATMATSSPANANTDNEGDAAAPTAAEIEAISDGEPSTAPQGSPEPSAQPANGVAQAPADDAEAEEIEVVIWRFSPRRPPARGNASDNKQSRRQRDANGAKPDRAKKAARSGNKDGRRGPHKGKKEGYPKKGAEGHAPRHRKTADPDSPFAVLADLKSSLANSPED
ncbi:MAG: helicase-related protein [Pseudomonadota bacterium]